MEYLVNSEEMKRCENYFIIQEELPSLVLMERAAEATKELLLKSNFDLTKILIVCGHGNNGGDGLALARLLYMENINVQVCFAGQEEASTIENKIQMELLQTYDIKIANDCDFKESSLLVDALFGIGLSRDIEGSFAQVISEMNDSGIDIISLDLPSGISSDTGKVMGTAIKAAMTVSFGFKKLGTVLYPGSKYAGHIILKDIGITEAGFKESKPAVESYNLSDLEKLPKREEDSNKGTHGKVLVIAGDVGMSGAAYFSAKAAYKSGAGLVQILTVKENRTILQILLPEAIVSVYDKDNINTHNFKKIITWATSIVFGPGMGTGENTSMILKALFEYSNVPLLIDADGLNVIDQEEIILKDSSLDLILTPHIGEMSRLVKKEINKVKINIIDEAQAYALENNLVCVLKDARTIVSDGSEVYLNQSGNSALSTAGTGDILTGVIAGLIAQGMDSLSASKLGVYIHGLAGEIASVDLGERSVIASDVLNALSDSFQL